jgi:hypothetical protein
LFEREKGLETDIDAPNDNLDKEGVAELPEHLLIKSTLVGAEAKAKLLLLKNHAHNAYHVLNIRFHITPLVMAIDRLKGTRGPLKKTMELCFSACKLGQTELGSDDWVSYGGISPPKFKS